MGREPDAGLLPGLGLIGVLLSEESDTSSGIENAKRLGNQEPAMSIDCRTRFHRDRRTLSRDEVFDDLFPEAIERNAALAARGVLYKGLPPLGLTVEGKTLTLREQNGRLELEEGASDHGAIAELGADALSDLVQDWKTTMGLAMNSQVEVTRGEFGDWVGWEPVFRALFDGRPVHEAGAIDFKNPDGSALDLSRSFDLDDDREEIAHFLHEAGFLHVRNVFTEEEMAAVSADLDVALHARSWTTELPGGPEIPQGPSSRFASSSFTNDQRP